MPWSKSSLPTGVSPAFAEPDVLDLSMSDQPFDYSSVEQPFDYSSRSCKYQGFSGTTCTSSRRGGGGGGGHLTNFFVWVLDDTTCECTIGKCSDACGRHDATDAS